jgi:transcriptional regulator with XRE-family HTH domain
MSGNGVVLKRLREMNKLKVKEAAALIGKSTGWLSQVENGQGFARLKPQEFERIVTLYGGDSLKPKFTGWMASETKAEKKKEISLDGAVLKYLREKAGLSLHQASEKLGLSKRYLSNLENGHKPIRLELREKLMRTYHYSPASFRNFTDVDKRAGNIPSRYKLNILLNQMDRAKIEKVFGFALEVTRNQSNQTTNVQGEKP